MGDTGYRTLLDAKGVSLEKLGLRERALSRDDALQALAELRESDLVALGGDVYFEADSIEVAFANWSVTPEPGESDSQFRLRGLKKADEYIRAFPEPGHKRPLFVLVVCTLSALPALLNAYANQSFMKKKRLPESDSNTRRLTPTERDVIRAMIQRISTSSEHQQALADLENCRVIPCADGEVLKFHIDGYERPAGGLDTFRGTDGFLVQGTVFDEDGVRIDVALLHDKNHRIFEFELCKHDGTPVRRPDWAKFQPTVLPLS